MQSIDETYASIQQAANYLKELGFHGATVGIVLGTGLGALTKELQETQTVDYRSIPNFPVSTVEFHAGKMHIGFLGNRKVIVMQGRMHFYEGYNMTEVTFPIRVLRALGIETLLLSGAAGTMHPDWKKGELMLLSDHINLQSAHPLIGKNDDRLGTRFPDMSETYDADLRRKLNATASHLGISLNEGVYVSVPGPMLETPAEYKFLRTIGADAVGMSTVPEVIVAKHASMRIAAVIVLTDECDPEHLQQVNIAQIIQTAQDAESKLIPLLTSFVAQV